MTIRDLEEGGFKVEQEAKLRVKATIVDMYDKILVRQGLNGGWCYVEPYTISSSLIYPTLEDEVIYIKRVIRGNIRSRYAQR